MLNTSLLKLKIMVIIIMGLPGSGKSYFAGHLSRHLDIPYIGSDQIRKEMGVMGHYGPTDKKNVYEQMKLLAQTAIQQGKDVILDATFYKKSIRGPFASLAQQHQVPLALIWVEAEEGLIRERLSKKREDSEADYGVYLTLKANFEPPLEPYLKLSSGPNNISEMLEEAEEYLRHFGMTRTDIDLFLKTATYQGEPMEGKVEETHISWIIFSKNHVIKIKKPVMLSFLDFSSLEKRKYFCHRELILNQRFSNIYLEVLPVINYTDRWSLGSGEGKIADYAVLMERMDSSKRMDKMLAENRVQMKDMEALAQEVAAFHQQAEVIDLPFDLEQANELFQDLEQVAPLIEKHLGRDQKKLILRSIEWSNQFLNQYAGRIQERHKSGFVRDLHGDLHGGNIFLYPKPVLFDCIEFNDAYRQIDVLYEIAFLCMELEAGGYQDLSGHFFMQYSQLISCIETQEDKALYQYYKCLRANIRAKVLAIQEKKSPHRKIQNAHLGAIQKYLGMMEKYIDETGK